MMRAAISSSLSALVDGTNTRNSSPPQRTIMSVSRSVSRSRRAMATSTASPAAWPKRSLVCLKRSMSIRSSAWIGRSGSPRRRRSARARRVAHEILEIAAVVERGQRVAAAAHAQFPVLLREQAVVDAKPAGSSTPSDAERRSRRSPRTATRRARAAPGSRAPPIERVLPVEELDLAPALVRLVLLLQLEHGALVRGRRHVLVELALAVVERERRPVVAGLLEILAVFAEQRRDFGGGAGALVLGERLVGVALAFARAAEAEQRESDVRLAGGDLARCRCTRWRARATRATGSSASPNPCGAA